MLTHPFNHAKQGASLLPPDDRAIYNELEKELKSRRAGRAQFLAEGKQLGRLLNPEVTYGFILLVAPLKSSSFGRTRDENRANREPTMVSARFDLFGPAQSTVGYTTTGEADDWLYGKMGIISMMPEVHENCLAHIWSSVVKFKGNLSKRRNP